MNPTTTNPHPPAADELETVDCAGCGHPVSTMDDLASIDDPSDPTRVVAWHVDCETELLEERRLEVQRAEELAEEGPLYGHDGPACYACGRPVLTSAELTMARDGLDQVAYHQSCYASQREPGHVIPCYYHADRPAVVNLDWSEDGIEVCELCIVRVVREVWPELAEPEMRIRPL
jgi:hypothetical protein